MYKGMLLSVKPEQHMGAGEGRAGRRRDRQAGLVHALRRLGGHGASFRRFVPQHAGGQACHRRLAPRQPEAVEAWKGLETGPRQPVTRSTRGGSSTLPHGPLMYRDNAVAALTSSGIQDGHKRRSSMHEYPLPAPSGAFFPVSRDGGGRGCERRWGCHHPVP